MYAKRIQSSQAESHNLLSCNQLSRPALPPALFCHVHCPMPVLRRMTDRVPASIVARMSRALLSAVMLRHGEGHTKGRTGVHPNRAGPHPRGASTEELEAEARPVPDGDQCAGHLCRGGRSPRCCPAGGLGSGSSRRGAEPSAEVLGNCVRKPPVGPAPRSECYVPEYVVGICLTAPSIRAILRAQLRDSQHVTT